MEKNFVEFLEKFIIKGEKDKVLSPVAIENYSSSDKKLNQILDKYLENYQFQIYQIQRALNQKKYLKEHCQLMKLKCCIQTMTNQNKLT